MGKGQRVGGHVDFGDDFDAAVLGHELQVAELLLRVVAVACCQAGEVVAFEAESGVGAVPVVLEVLFETVVVEMDLERVHLVVRHDFHVVAEVVDGEELAGAVDHEAAHGIVGPVADVAAGEGVVVALLADLEQGAGGPVDARRGGGVEDGAVADAHAVAFGAELLVLAQGEDDVAGLAFSGGHFEACAEHVGIVGLQGFGHFFKFGRAFGIDDARRRGGDELPRLARPCFQFGDDEGLGVDLGVEPGGGEQEKGGRQPDSVDFFHKR